MPAPRHIGFSALFLDPGVSGGPDTYLRGLVPAIAREFPQLELTVFTTRRGAHALCGDGWTDFARIVHFPFDEGERGRRLLAEQVGIVGGSRRRGVDVLHSLASVGPAVPLTRSVVTLHDVTFFRMRTFGRATTLAMKVAVLGAARSADVLIAVSAASRDDICAELDIDAARFVVVPHGPGRPARVAPAEPSALRRRLGADKRRLVVCVGALRPHKNQRQLVEALVHLPDDVAVVLAGAQELHANELLPLARRLGVDDRLLMPGFLADPELEALWSTATCAAFPTRAEGFGLPVLEAMRRGVPVACSDIPVLREVGGEVAHYFPLDDPAAAAATIVQAMGDVAAAHAGPARASSFSWEAAARGTYAAYQRAVA